ncbi:MAG: Na+/H+ antiporter NhaC family protein [Lachnospiraceae bacterium]
MFKVVAQGPNLDGTGGIMGMYDITVISIVVACIVSLVKEMGGIQFILNFIKKRVKGKRGGRNRYRWLGSSGRLCTANNTVAIVMAGPIAKEISQEFEISPRRSASLLDMFTSVGQGLIPYGAQSLAARRRAFTELTPFDIIPVLSFTRLLMAVSGCGIVFCS